MPTQTDPLRIPLNAGAIIEAFRDAGEALAAAMRPPPFDHLGQSRKELAHAVDALLSEPPQPGAALTYVREAQHHLRQHEHHQLLTIEQPKPDPWPLIEAATGRADTDLARVYDAARSFGPCQVESIRRDSYRREALPYAQGWADCLAYLAERAQEANGVRRAIALESLAAGDAVVGRPFSGLAETFAMIDRARCGMGRDEVVLRDGRKVRVTLSSASGVRLVSWQLGEAESTQGDCVAALDADFAGMRMTDGGLA